MTLVLASIIVVTVLVCNRLPWVIAAGLGGGPVGVAAGLVCWLLGMLVTLYVVFAAAAALLKFYDDAGAKPRVVSGR